MKRKARPKGKRAGVHHRSGFEAAIRKDLDARDIAYEYEAKSFGLHVPSPNHYCEHCTSGKISRRVRYTPDFLFPNGVVVEAKGKFTARDRKIALAMTQQFAGWPYRMMFQRDNKLSPKSSTRYSDWCRSYGIVYTIGTVVPRGWLK